MDSSVSPPKLGILVGGGPAPGINGVICSVTIGAVNLGWKVLGFRDGFKHLVKGRTDMFTGLDIPDVTPYYQRGGSLLGTLRTNPTKKPEDMARVLEAFRALGINYLVTIGGDDTAFSASHVAREAGNTIRVAHVPKTIDNDLPLPDATPTFGFETAHHLGTYTARALHEDARTTGRWYIIVSMGRAAGHLALGIGKASAATVTIIPEEFGDRPVTLDEVCDIIIGSVVKRSTRDKRYGLVVLAEGLIEAIGEKGLIEALGGRDKLDRYGTLDYDSYGNLRMASIDFGRVVRDHLRKRLLEPARIQLEPSFIDKELGYELRCADPIPFDVQYTRDLGYAAVKFLLSEASARYGAIVCFDGAGKMQPLPLDAMLDPRTGKMQTRRVSITSEAFECALRYMIRLERRDFDDPDRLAKLAEGAGLSTEAFRKRFGYLVGA